MRKFISPNKRRWFAGPRKSYQSDNINTFYNPFIAPFNEGTHDSLRFQGGGGVPPYDYQWSEQLKHLKSTFNPYNWGVPDLSYYKNQGAAYRSTPDKSEFLYKGVRIKKDIGADNRNSAYLQNKTFWGIYKDELKEKYPDDEVDKRYNDALDLHYRYGNPKINVLSDMDARSGKYGTTYSDVKQGGRSNFITSDNSMQIFYNKSGKPNRDFLIHNYQQELLHARQLQDVGVSEFRARIWRDYKRHKLDIWSPTFKEDYDKLLYGDKESFEGVHDLQTSGLRERYDRDYALEEQPIYKKERFKILSEYRNKKFHPYIDQGDLRIIQRSLVEQGYKLPESLKRDGTFDGIYGKETKDALSDFQKRQKVSSLPGKAYPFGRFRATRYQGGGYWNNLYGQPDNAFYNPFIDTLNEGTRDSLRFQNGGGVPPYDYQWSEQPSYPVSPLPPEGYATTRTLPGMRDPSETAIEDFRKDYRDLDDTAFDLKYGMSKYRHRHGPRESGRVDYVPLELAFLPAARGLGKVGNIAADIITGTMRPGVGSVKKDVVKELRQELLEKGIVKSQKTPNLPWKEPIRKGIEPWGYLDKIGSPNILTGSKFKDIKGAIFSGKNPLYRTEKEWIAEENLKKEFLRTDPPNIKDMPEIMKEPSLKKAIDIRDKDRIITKGGKPLYFDSMSNRYATWDMYLGKPQTKHPLYDISDLTKSKDDVIYTIKEDFMNKPEIEKRFDEYIDNIVLLEKKGKNRMIMVGQDDMVKKGNSWIVPDFDKKMFGTMHGFHWEVNKLPDGNYKVFANDVWSLHPLKETSYKLLQPFKNIEVGKALGIGKPLNVKVGFIIDGKTKKIINTFGMVPAAIGTGAAIQSKEQEGGLMNTNFNDMERFYGRSRPWIPARQYQGGGWFGNNGRRRYYTGGPWQPDARDIGMTTTPWLPSTTNPIGSIDTGGLSPYAKQVGIAGGVAGLVGMGTSLYEQAHPEEANIGAKVLKGAASGAAMGTAIAPGWGTAAGAVVGGGIGAVSGVMEKRQLEEEKEKKDIERQNLEQMRYYDPQMTYQYAPTFRQGGKMPQWLYETRGRMMRRNQLLNGGEIPLTRQDERIDSRPRGYMGDRFINEDLNLTHYYGNKHDDIRGSGIPIGENETEGGEVRIGDYIFSDNINLDGTEKSVPKKSIGQYQRGGPLTTRELYEQRTGKPWSTAKAEGLTTGSYAANIRLRQQLLEGEELSGGEVPVYDDKNTFGKAFRQARIDLGAHQIFTYKGKEFTTNLKGEEIKPYEPAGVAAQPRPAMFEPDLTVLPRERAPVVERVKEKAKPHIPGIIEERPVRPVVKPEIKPEIKPKIMEKELPEVFTNPFKILREEILKKISVVEPKVKPGVKPEVKVGVKPGVKEVKITKKPNIVGNVIVEPIEENKKIDLVYKPVKLPTKGIPDIKEYMKPSIAERSATTVVVPDPKRVVVSDKKVVVPTSVKVEKGKVSFESSDAYIKHKQFSELPAYVQDVVYEEKKNPSGRNYFILNKEDVKVYLFDKNHNYLKSMVVLLGMNKGDYINTVDIEWSKEKARKTGLATTPAGKVSLGHWTPDKDLPKGGAYFHYEDPEFTTGVSAHEIYPKEYEARMKALLSPEIEDNRISYGCVNILEIEEFQKIIKVASPGYISPEEYFKTPQRERTDIMKKELEGVVPIDTYSPYSGQKINERYNSRQGIGTYKWGGRYQPGGYGLSDSNRSSYLRNKGTTKVGKYKFSNTLTTI